MRLWKWLFAICLIVVAIAAYQGLSRGRHVVPFPDAAQAAIQSHWVPTKAEHVLLPESALSEYSKFYLANQGIAVESWQPTPTDLRSLAADLPQIRSLHTSEHDPRQIDNLDRYFLQYLPIVQSGKKRIFVNAFCNDVEGAPNDWHHHLQAVYDGGDCFWQVYYDPATHRFSNLMINGLG
jgi:hypothetical protein